MAADDARGAEVRRQAAAAVARFVADDADLDAERVDPTTWRLTLTGEHKRSVPTTVHVGERHTSVQSFFMRAPDENEGALYRFLLSRHLRSYLLRFAVTDDGDILLVGVVPNAAVDADELDRLLGQVLAIADEAFAGALRRGFAGYIAREQAWRERVGAPPNPIT